MFIHDEFGRDLEPFVVDDIRIGHAVDISVREKGCFYGFLLKFVLVIFEH